MASSNRSSSDNSEEVYAVERILAKRTRQGVVEYQVRWEGYGSDGDTWEPVSKLAGFQEVEEFEKSRRQPPQPANVSRPAVKRRASGVATTPAKKKASAAPSTSAQQQAATSAVTRPRGGAGSTTTPAKRQVAPPSTTPQRAAGGAGKKAVPAKTPQRAGNGGVKKATPAKNLPKGTPVAVKRPQNPTASAASRPAPNAKTPSNRPVVTANAAVIVSSSDSSEGRQSVPSSVNNSANGSGSGGSGGATASGGAGDPEQVPCEEPRAGKRYQLEDGKPVKSLQGLRRSYTDGIGIVALVEYEDDSFEIVPTQVLMYHCVEKLRDLYESRLMTRM